MDKYEELANRIIDRVSELIEDKYDLKPKFLTDDDSIENPALINGTIYYDLESEIADDIRDTLTGGNGYFQIPHMMVHKDDIRALFEGSDDEADYFKAIEELSDEEMQEIADDMTDTMVELQYHDSLKESFEKILEKKNGRS